MSRIEMPTAEGPLPSGARAKSNVDSEHGPSKRESQPPLPRGAASDADDASSRSAAIAGDAASSRSAAIAGDAASSRSYMSVLPVRKVSLSQRVPLAHRVVHGDLSTRQSNNMLVAFDERHAPLFITTFEGSLDLEAVMWHDSVSTNAIVAAMNGGRGIVHIVDARRVAVPNAELRRHWATRIQQSVSTLETMLGNFVVIDSPMLRGVLTAIEWLCDEGRRIEYFSTLADAVAVANLRLAAAGYAPIVLEAVNYRVTTSLDQSSTPSASVAG